MPRRYDGDWTLPPGRYSTVCIDATGDDGGTLAREMTFFANARVAEGHVEVYDGTVPAHADMIEVLGMAPNCPRLVLRLMPFAQNDADAPRSWKTGIELELREVRLPNVLDLRRTTAATWLCRTISRLSIVMPDRARFRCFPPERPDLDDPADVWPSLMDQSRGGGNFHKIVGLYLRALGVSGLVFPSARGDACVTVADGESVAYHGWSFVDYRDAPDARIVAFAETRPEPWPSCLTLEGGDHNRPRPAAYADEVTFTADGYASGNGSITVTGLKQRMRALHLGNSAEGAILHRLGRSNEDEDVRSLIALLAWLSAHDAEALPTWWCSASSASHPHDATWRPQPTRSSPGTRSPACYGRAAARQP